jgi:MFS family permease
VAFVLSFAYAVSFIDRVIVSLLVQPIKVHLQVTDTQMSLLVGFSFILFYALLGFPIGRLADRSNRRNIVIAGATVWSLMTVLSGMATSFWHLFFARMGVGIGEASLSPCAYSLISDYFPRDKLAGAMSVYNMGIYAGSGLALLLGGAMLHLVSGAPSVTLPWIGVVAPWQFVFVFAGLLGFVVAALMLTVKEPARPVTTTRTGAGPPHAATFSEAGRFILQHRAVLLPLTAGFLLVSVIGFAINSWVPAFLMRTYGMALTEVGFQYGLIVLIGGAAGVLCGGWLGDLAERRWPFDGKMRVAALGVTMLSLPGALGPLAGNQPLALALMAAAVFLASFPLGIGAATLQLVVPNRLRAQLSALFLIVVSIGGVSLGPLAVALITDHVFGDEAALRYSLALVLGVAAPLAGWTLWAALAPMRTLLGVGKPVPVADTARP